MATAITAGVKQITVKVDKPTDRDDIGGLLIWISTVSGFVPDATTLVYKGPDFLVPLVNLAGGTPLVAGTTYYLKLALWSVIDDGAEYDLSGQYQSTPTAPTVAAGDVTGQLTEGQLSIAVGGGNLLPNSSFEADTNSDGVPDDWAATSFGTGITIARSLPASPLVHGAKSLQLTVSAIVAPTSTNYHSVGLDGGKTVAVKPGRKYRLSAYAETSVAAYGAILQIQWLDAPKTTAVGYSNIIKPTLGAVATPERIVSSTFTAPAGAVWARIYFGIARPGTSDTTLGNVKFDGIQLEEGDIATAYAPLVDEILPYTVTLDKLAVDVLNANNINAGGTMRGSHLFSGSVGTKGTTLTSPVAAGDTTINVQSTVDFPASGSAIMFATAAASDFDLFTYTGKTDTSFTGVAGALAHSSGQLVLPLDKVIALDKNTNELRFVGDRGDGVFEVLAAIGVTSSGSDTVIGKFGTSTSSRVAVDGQSNGASATANFTNYGTGYAAQFQSLNGSHAAFFKKNAANKSSVLIEPGAAASTTAGSVGELVMEAGSKLSTWDGARKYFLRDGDTLTSSDGTAAAPSHSFRSTFDMGMYLRTNISIGWSIAGAETMWLVADGLNVPTAPATDNSTKAATTAHVLARLNSLGLGALTLNNFPQDNLNNDTINLSGFYNSGAATAGVNPIAAGHLGIVQHFVTGAQGMQLFVSTQNGRTFVRRRASSVWEPWKEIAFLGDENSWAGGQVYTGLNYDFQGGITAVNAATVLTAAQVLNQIIRSNPVGPITHTLPSATDLDTASGLTVGNQYFDFSVENITTAAANTVTLALGAGITNSVRSLVIKADHSAMFRLRKTGAGAWVIYRVAG